MDAERGWDLHGAFVRLDLFDSSSASGPRPRHAGSAPEDSGTPEPSFGVWSTGTLKPSRPPRVRTWIAVAFLAWSLLGAGERCGVDLRLVSPSSTLATYWEGLRSGDEGSAAECMVDGFRALPQAGELWFLPPTARLELFGFRSLPVSSGRVMVTYEVRYLPEGTGEVQSFRTGNELVRERGEWRILRALGEASLPEWKPVRRTVDS